MFERLKKKLASRRKSGVSRQENEPAKTERDDLYGKYDHNHDEVMRGNVGNTYTRHPGGGPMG